MPYFKKGAIFLQPLSFSNINKKVIAETTWSEFASPEYYVQTIKQVFESLDGKQVVELLNEQIYFSHKLFELVVQYENEYIPIIEEQWSYIVRNHLIENDIEFEEIGEHPEYYAKIKEEAKVYEEIKVKKLISKAFQLGRKWQRSFTGEEGVKPVGLILHDFWEENR